MKLKNIVLTLLFLTGLLICLDITSQKAEGVKGVKATAVDGRKILIYDDGTWIIAPKEIFNIPVGDSDYLGAKDAKVTVIEWMDYQ